MKRKLRVISVILTVAVITALFTGCGNNSGSTASNELIYCVIGEERKDSPVVMEKVNAILKEKTGATIKLKYLSTDNYDLVISSGENYDIIAAPDFMGFWTNAAKGAFAELTDEDIKTYAPYIWENGQKYLFATKSGGKRYGIPGFHEYAPDRCYVARGDLMDKYGIEALNNIDDVEKYLFAVADGENEIIPFDMEGFSPYFILNMWASDWGWAAVGSLSFGEHVYFDINDPERKLFCAIDRPEMKEFTERIKKWNDKGVFSKSVLSNKIFSEDSFKNGRSALCWTSSPEAFNRMWNEFQQDDRKAWDIRVYPVYSKYQRMYNYLNSVASVSNFSKNKEKSLEVLNEIYSNEELYDLLIYGIKGQHFDVSEDGYMMPLDVDSYAPPVFGLSNDAYNKKTKLEFPGAEELVKKLESFRVYDPVINCNVDFEGLAETELALDEVYKTYTTARCYGAIDDVSQALKEEKEALEKAGIEEYRQKLQERVKEFVSELEEK